MTKAKLRSQKEATVNSSQAWHLRQHCNVIASLSICHLSAETRLKLARNDLSVNAYPNEFGGFIYLGKPAYIVPVELDLMRIVELASRVGAEWLRFDVDAAVVDGLPVYRNTSWNAQLAKLGQ